MIKLIIDSSTFQLNVAIVDDTEIIAYKYLESDRKHSEFLMPSIQNLFDISNLTINDVDKIVVTNGPGSFTGIRLGITVAKTLAKFSDIDIVPISTLKAFLFNLSSNTKVCLLDAKRDFYYVRVESNDQVIIHDKMIHIDEIIDILKDLDDISITGVYDEELLHNVVYKKIDFKFNYMNISVYADTLDVVDAHFVNPNYIKKTQAEIDKYGK